MRSGLCGRCWAKSYAYVSDHFYLADEGYRPTKIIQTSRLGIPEGRDERLLYRFIDYKYARNGTRNPLTKKGWRANRDYIFHFHAFMRAYYSAAIDFCCIVETL